MNQDEVLRHLQIDGWYVIEGVIPTDEVGTVRESVERSTTVHSNPEAPEGIGHVPGFIRYDQSLAPYLADRDVLGVVEEMLGHHVRISFTTATINYPGNQRGKWHADWPFNQNNAGHIPAPYPDATMHLTTLWMLSPFTRENGGTLIVPGSHRARNNPTGDNGVNADKPYPTEMQATGPAGSVLVIDSRMWHATAPNRSNEPRTSVVVRYAPWWLNLDVIMPGSVERARLVDETGGRDNLVPLVPPQVYDALPNDVKPLFRHWVEARRGKDAQNLTQGRRDAETQSREEGRGFSGTSKASER
jgi:hypothetical protein